MPCEFSGQRRATMMASGAHGITRRRAVAVGLAGAVVLARPTSTSAQVLMQRGMIGGGLAKLDSGEANLSLVATEYTLPDSDGKVVIGRLLWVESGTGLSLASTEITTYDDLPGQEEGRRIGGT